jgi:hypothetical protein
MVGVREAQTLVQSGHSHHGGINSEGFRHTFGKMAIRASGERDDRCEFAGRLHSQGSRSPVRDEAELDLEGHGVIADLDLVVPEDVDVERLKVVFETKEVSHDTRRVER